MNWQIYLLALIFVLAGIFHLIKPKAFMRVMPLYIPYHKEIVYLSGVLEILVGVGLLFIHTQHYSLLAIIVLLILFFPVHIHMLMNQKASLNLSKYVLIFRLLLQFGLIYWVFTLIH